jgi:membrane-associated phospholipid phosphatase
MAYYASVVNLQTERHRNTVALLALALDFIYPVAMRFKYALACPRPSDYSSVIQPMIEVPQHGSLPAGHATEGYLIAGILAVLVPGAYGNFPQAHLNRIAHRIAENRIVAGLHFPIDNVAGRLLGETLAGLFLALCGAKLPDNAPVTPDKAVFDGAGLSAGNAPAGKANPDTLLGNQPGCRQELLRATVDSIPVLEEMWAAASQEWRS